MRKFWSSMVNRTDPYVPGEQLNQPGLIKLNTNENPYPPSPKVAEAIKDEMGNLMRYPSPTADLLREEIGKLNDLTADQVFIGNGSDEVLAFSFMAFFEPGKTIRFPDVTYSFYPVYAKLFDIPYEETPLNKDFTISPEGFYGSEGGVIFANPNAPTGIYLELQHVEKILQENPDVVAIVDEAYIDFGGESAASLINEYANLLVVQTTSKSRSLAGLRVGYALGQAHLIEALVRIKDSFNSYTIDRLALCGALASFRDHADFTSKTMQIVRTREMTAQKLTDLGFQVIPSQANFLFASHPDYEAKQLYLQLKQRNVLVRYFDKRQVDGYLRISIGTDEEMEEFLGIVGSIVGKSV
ncbi:histidinol-phosphate transaminase [Virgibacillus sp. 179-BFC.A HS]|uniref:Histidinol-phosphate aminotransferase n=1 Tax=Tigheibacillus jepli TaxID=3035914 RepID=A0ABU5CKH6_9BACI|nr:histidinol-phosphate transaminase [Virgibacillus sp. 179-BFC.A HS]MDY0406815.1 histidinol-phosphate transaminase [Virgibacillus sp. 179-BFC.A HS]